MGWRTVVVRNHSKLSYRNNHLLYQSAERSEQIHLSEIDSLILETTNISITTMLLKCLVDWKIAVIFCDEKALPIAGLTPFCARYDSSLALRQQLSWAQERKEAAWIAILKQKISNQSAFLLKAGYQEAAANVKQYQEVLTTNDVTNCEAHAARMYFATLYGNQFSRQLNNDLNAALNFGYSLILSLFAREIAVCGCALQLGLQHSNQFNPYNLASDLMEPFRVLIDVIVFANKEESFCLLKPKLLSVFEETYLYNGQQCYLTNIVREYVRNFIKFLNGVEENIPIFTYEF